MANIFGGFHTEEIGWDKLKEHNIEGWIYRGHKNSDWHLRTTLDRACEVFFGNLSKADEVEYTLLREFRRRYHHFERYIPKREDELQWLSIMQHYGAPTRLLDWTYSIYVAAYFAVESDFKEDSDNACAIWALNYRWAYSEAKKLYANEKKDPSAIDEDTDDFDLTAFSRTFVQGKPILCVCLVTPFVLNQRLTIQKGTLACPGDVTSSFEDNLKALAGHGSPENVKRLVLPKSERKKALRSLDDMNISRATLFPGLDGFAQSLKIYHPLVSDEKRLKKRRIDN